MRDAIGCVLGLVVAIGVMLAIAFGYQASAGQRLAASVFLLVALVAFPVCIGGGVALARRFLPPR